MEILTLIKANIRYRRGSFISVLVLTFIIALCLSTIISININIAKRADSSLKLNHVGDLVSIIWDAKCPDSMLNKVEENPNVDHINIVNTVTQIIEINEIQQGSTTFFIPYDKEKEKYQIYNENGLSFQSKPKELQKGEIYVPISFKRLYNCRIGDKAYLTEGDSKRGFTIQGFFEEPFVGSEVTGIKLALMNEEDFNILYSERIRSLEERDSNPNGIRGYYLVNIDLDKSSKLSMSEIRRSINDETGIIEYSMFTISKEQSKSYTLMFTQIISGIMMIFLMLLFIVVLIVMGHSISTGIELDYTNLGILKAIGFHKGSLRQMYVFEYLLAEIFGASFGIVGSIPAIYYLNSVFVNMSGLLSSVRPSFGICVMLQGAILLISALYIIIKTKAIIRVSPVCAISGGRESIYFHSKLELPVEGKGLLFRMAFRQLTSNLKQYISSTFMVTILVFFLVTITVLSTGMDKKTIQNSFGVTFSDLDIDFNPKYDKSQEEIAKLKEQVEKDIANISEVKTSFKVDSNYFTVNGDEYHSSIYNDPTLINSVVKGRAPLYSNEIVVTDIVAKELGVKIGDTVTLENEKQEEDYIISGYFQSTSDLGRTISMSYEAAKKIMPGYYMDYVEYVIAKADKSAEIVKMLESKYGKQIAVRDANAEDDFGDTIISSMSIMNYIIYTISVIFVFIVIIIVCGKIFLKERTDYGIYKALGFSTFTLRLQFAIRFVIIALIGSLLGIGLNICLNNTMMSTLLRNIGISNFTTKYNMLSIALPILVMSVCFFVFAYLVSGKIKRVDTKNLISSN